MPPDGSKAPSAGGMNQQWKNPTPDRQQKYSIQPLPNDFEPNLEEQNLLKFYETIRSYERTAKRLKDTAARERLAAREREFQKQNEGRKKKRKKKKVAAEYNPDAMSDNINSSDACHA